MRTKITNTGVIASRSANRIYDEGLQVIFDELKPDEAKEVFPSTVLLRAAANLATVLRGDDFDKQIDMLVEIAKEKAHAVNDS